MAYIGDISKEDAALLTATVRDARRIFEFGVGASTQVMARAAPVDADLISLETDPAWIARTRRNFAILGIARPVTFLPYDGWQAAVSGEFDVVFDDGVDALRLPFAMAAWPLLRVGGVMMFHDTRRPGDMRNVLDLVASAFLSVESVSCNAEHSNITVVRKKAPEPYVDWNLVERRSRWQVGQEEAPDDL
jgi:predicted O-methyltransferase YrrM